MTALAAANTYCPEKLKQGKSGYSVSIQGTFVGKITVARSKDKVTWQTIGTFTTSVELDGEFATAYYVRAGFNPGDWTSGSAEVNVY